MGFGVLIHFKNLFEGSDEIVEITTTPPETYSAILTLLCILIDERAIHLFMHYRRSLIIADEYVDENSAFRAVKLTSAVIRMTTTLERSTRINYNNKMKHNSDYNIGKKRKNGYNFGKKHNFEITNILVDNGLFNSNAGSTSEERKCFDALETEI